MGKKGDYGMEERNIKEQLGTVNQSLFYLILIVLSVLLSIWSVLIQREQLEEMLWENPQKKVMPDVYPIKLSASVLVVGALGFFFCLSLQTCRDVSQGTDLAAQKSAGMNVWASIFVLAAALIRLYDLGFMEEVQHSLNAENVQHKQNRNGIC